MDIDLSDAKPTRARRTHRKSRLGCANCKRRRIKCDEKRPGCSNCSSHLIECAYNSTVESPGSQSPSFLQAPTERPCPRRYQPHRYATGGLKQTFKISGQPSKLTESTGTQCDSTSGLFSTITVADLQLFHHYTIDTYQSMTAGADLSNLWQKHLVHWGIQFPPILHLILALSALHLAYKQPDLREQYIQQADNHFSFGTRSITRVLSELNTDNCQKIYMSAVMICFIYFGRGPRPGQYLIFSDSGPAEWLVLMRGVRLIVLSHRAEVFSGLLQPGPNDWSHTLTAEMRRELHEHTVQTEAVRRLVQRDIADGEARGRYLAVIEDLLEIMREVYERRSAGSSGVELMDLLIGWLYRLPQEIIGSIEQKEPHALVILAHWAVLLKYMGSAWFMDGWAEHVLSGISTYLHESFHPWIKWPLEKVYPAQVS